MPRSSKSTTAPNRASSAAEVRDFIRTVMEACSLKPRIMMMLLATHATPEIVAHMRIGKKTKFVVTFFGSSKMFRSLESALRYQALCLRIRSFARRSVARWEVQKKKFDREENARGNR